MGMMGEPCGEEVTMTTAVEKVLLLVAMAMTMTAMTTT